MTVMSQNPTQTSLSTPSNKAENSSSGVPWTAITIVIVLAVLFLISFGVFGTCRRKKTENSVPLMVNSYDITEELLGDQKGIFLSNLALSA